MNGSTSNPPCKYRADVLFWSTPIWGLHWLCGGELDQVAGMALGSDWNNWRCQSQKKEEVGNDTAGHMLAFFGTLPCPPCRDLTVLGHSCRHYGRLAAAEDGGRRENRAAYWDNNSGYAGDSCNLSGTALKPSKATLASFIQSRVGEAASSSFTEWHSGPLFETDYLFIWKKST